jgi:hypothetical protein
VSAWVALACWAATTSGPSATDGSPNQLALRIAAPPAVIAAVSARLAPRLAALGVALDLASVPDVNLERVLASPPDDNPEAPLARGWLDAQNIDGAVLLLIPRRADRVLMRRVPLTLGVDEAGLAQITFIIERSVASLLASEPIGVPHAEARAALGAALPAPPSADAAPVGARQLALQVGIFGGLASWSSETRPALRVGLDLWIDWITDGKRIGVAASAVADPSFHDTDANSDLMMRAISLHGWMTAGRDLGPFGVGRVALGPALLVTRVTPMLTSSPADTAAVAARTDLEPIVGLAARWDLPLGGGTTAFLAATVDVVPWRAQYTAVVNGTNRTLFSPWPVRPAAVLGLSIGSQRQRR